MLQKILKYIYILPTICLAITVLYFAKTNYPLVAENIKSTTIDEFDTSAFDDSLQENFNDKYFFINLNGMMTRYLGINTLNGRQLLANGYLAGFPEKIDIDAYASNFISLANFLKKNNIEFLCSIIPTKPYFYGTPFAPGYDEGSHQDFESFVNKIENGGVDFLNMDSWFKKNGWGFEDVYFKTDHHWLPEAAFQTTKEIMKFFEENEIASYDKSSLDMDNWTVEVYENYFLGSEGRRTGTKYARGGGR